MKVVVDAMGSDRAPGPEVAGALRTVRASPIDVTLVGDASRLEAELARAGRTSDDAIEVVHASEVVTMHDHPAQAFRAKPDSSMRVAVARVTEGEGDAVVSAGNSGAMLACALFVLGRLPGVERPAIVTVLPDARPARSSCATRAPTPSPSPPTWRSSVSSARPTIASSTTAPRPRLGLLSNGAEPGKGTPLTREAHALLAAASGDFQYLGYVEGSDLFRGVVDVIATDGFTGNIVLKTCEGIAEGLFGLVRQELEKTPLARLGSALVAPALRDLAKRIDYTEIGGALLAGVTRPAVIAHGRSDANAIGLRDPRRRQLRGAIAARAARRGDHSLS